MVRDVHGQPLQPGDQILVPATVKELRSSDLSVSQRLILIETRETSQYGVTSHMSIEPGQVVKV